MSQINQKIDFPRNLVEFNKRFSTEEACRLYLGKIRWPDGFRCPGCRSSKAWQTNRGNLFCADCKRQTSVTAGTIFDRTKQPLELWFKAAWLIVSEKHGISALGLQRQLGLSRYETAWQMLRRLRRAMVRPRRELLTGEVEVDETLVGGPTPGRRGRSPEGKALVVVAAEKDGNKIGRIRMKTISDASGKTLNLFIRENVEEGSVVETDGWRGYWGLSKLDYEHRRVDGESVGIDEVMPRINRVASLLKRWLLGTHHGRVDKAGLDSYLNEFTFRFNRRSSSHRGKLFGRLIEQSVQTTPAYKL